MKFKCLSIIVCVCMIAFALLATSFENQDGKRFHQHLEAGEVMACTGHGEETFCTHLPLVQIDTGNEEIPGKAIIDESGTWIGYTKTAGGADEIRASIRITDHEGSNNHLDDTPAVESNIRIHIRGNSSRAFDKSSYAVRLITESGENNPQCVMGMDAHHEWVLHGPFLDKTLLRNYMWYNIAGDIMDYAPNVRFCEVFLNGAYQGVYVMAESVTAGRDGARLTLSVDKKNTNYTGYLLRLDRGSTTEMKNIETLSGCAHLTKMQLNIVYPGSDNLTEALRAAIVQDFSDFEKVLYSFDYDDPAYGYERRIDVDSFVDYFLINELTSNYDAMWLSTYIYKGVDGRFRMCVWDFNSACDGYPDVNMPEDGFQLQYSTWYVMLFKDEEFVERVLSRYEQLRRTTLSDEALDSYIDGIVDYLGEAVDRNYERWGYSFGEEYDMLIPAERNPRSYGEAIEQMRGFLHRRGAWMDENIHTLRQYAAESKVKKYNENAN